MSTFDKMKSKILKTPSANDITTEEVKSFLQHYGFILKRSKGSHFIYGYPNSNIDITINIPMHNPVKPAYIDLIRKAILEIEGGEL